MTRRPLTIGVLALAAVTLAPAVAAAQILRLTVSPTTISIPSADPDVLPIVAAAPVTVSVRVVSLSGQGWRLTVLANGDLISGTSTIPISNVSWIATPTPTFQNGTLNKTVAQTLASGPGQFITNVNGSVTFRYANAWTYNAGTYSQTLVVTLSMP